VPSRAGHTVAIRATRYGLWPHYAFAHPRRSNPLAFADLDLGGAKLGGVRAVAAAPDRVQHLVGRVLAVGMEDVDDALHLLAADLRSEDRGDWPF
jgi:hypothetical protein